MCKSNQIVITTLQIIYSKLSDLLPAEVLAEDDPTLVKPDDEEIQDTTEKTRQALEKLTSSKISAAMPVRCVEKSVCQITSSIKVHMYLYCSLT